MPTWKKIVVSGSNITQLVNDANYLIDGQSAASLSGSFSGSFYGDGSNLTNVSATSIEFANIQNKPTLVSGSEQITISDVDGYTAFSQSIDDHLDSKVSDLSGDIDSLSGSAHTQRVALDSAQTTALSNVSGAFAASQAVQDGKISALESFSSSLDSTFATDAEVASAVNTLSGSAHTQRLAIESGLSSDITSLSSSAATANANLSSDLTSAFQSADTALSSSAHTQRVAIETSLDGKINTEKGRIDAILSASTADADSFKEIVDLINSVDTTNDQAFAAFYTASNNRLSSLETNSGSQDTRITDLENFSSSLDATFATNVELSDLSSSAHTQRTAIESGLSSDIDSLSGSAHTQRTAISGAFASTISNLSQTLSISGSTGDADVDLKTQDLSFVGDGGGISTSISGTTVSLVSNGVVSGSSQVTISDTTGYTAFSQSIDTHLDAKVSDLSGDIDSLSGSAHTQRLAIETSLDGKINTEKGRIDAILLASDADKDSFAEIVTLINQVDTTNDQVFAGYATASNARFDALETTSGSHDTRITDLENFSSSLSSTFATDAELASLSSSAHTQRTAIESGLSSDIDSLSGSAHNQRLAIESGLSSDIDSLSGSAHTQRTAISGAFATTISNLSQTLSISGSTGDVDVDLKSQDLTIAGDGGGISTSISGTTISLVSNGVVSGSSQVTISDTTGYAAFSQSIDTHLDAKVSDLTGDISSLSGSAHTQRVAIETSLDGKINTEKGRIDAILSASTADADSFKEIVDLINSVDTTNDQAFAAFYTASNNRLSSLETNSGSQDTRISALESFSSSLDSEFATDAEVTSLSSSIATTLSGLSQTLTVNGDTGTDGVDLKTEALNIEGDGGGITTSVDAGTNTISLVSNGIVSSSAQTVANLVGQDIVANSFTGNGSGLTNVTIAQTSTVVETFSGVTSYTVTHNFGSDNVLATVYDSNGFQIIPASVQASGANTVEVTFAEATSGKVIVGQGGHIVSGSVPFANITGKPTLISGSSQVLIDNVTGFTDFSSSVDSRLDALDGTFATDADLTALSSSAHTQRVAIETTLAGDISTNASDITSLSSSAATANSNLSSSLDTAYKAADTALSASIATTISNLSSTLTISGSTGNDTVNLVNDSLSVVGTAGEIETTVTNNQIQVGIVSNPTLTGNVTVTGNLTVTGDTVQAQVSNLEVEDRFILLNSGSNSGDAGIIFGGSDGTANVGSGIFWDSPANVFGFAQGIASTDSTSTHQSKLGNIEIAAGAPTGAPLFQGVGTIYVDSSTGDIMIYS